MHPVLGSGPPLPARSGLASRAINHGDFLRPFFPESSAIPRHACLVADNGITRRIDHTLCQKSTEARPGVHQDPRHFSIFHAHAAEC